MVSTETYVVEFDLTRRPKPGSARSRPSGSVPHPAPPRSSTSSTARSPRSRSTARRSTRPSTPTAASRSPTSPPTTSCASRPPACTRTPARAYTGSSTRSMPSVPLHAVRGARRPPGVHHVRAARPQGDLRVPRHRAVHLAGRVELPHARAGTGARRSQRVALRPHRADVDLHHRARGRRVPRRARRLPRRVRRDSAGPVLPPVAAGAPRRRRRLARHQAGVRVLRAGLRDGLPVRQVRPAVRAGVQHGRDGERRLR